MPKLTDTQLVTLSAAAQQPDRLAAPPKIPAAAQAAVGRSLLKAGLLATAPLPAGRTAFAWKLERDTTTGLAITDAGLAAIGVEPDAPQGANTAPTVADEPAPQEEPAEARQPLVAALDAVPWGSLRDRATAVLAAWDSDRDALADAVEALRAALTKSSRAPREPRAPRTGTKQESVLDMVRRPEGATLAEICTATGWQRHTARAFLSVATKRLGLTLIAAREPRVEGEDLVLVYRLG